MDWEQLREVTLGEVATSLATEGIGVAGGLVAGGAIGSWLETYVKPGVTTTSPLIDKLVAWAINNAPKLGIWYLLKGYTRVMPGEEVSVTKAITIDMKKSMAGSFALDSLIRLTNNGAPLAVRPTLFGIPFLSGNESPQIQKSAQADIQRLVQENSALRAELNKALQKLASQPAIRPPTPVVPMAPVVQAPPPTVQAAPVTPYQQPPTPPVVRYTPVTPSGAVPPYGTPIPPYTKMQQPLVRAEAITPAAPITQVVQAARQPVVRAEPIVTAQPLPPEVQQREKRYGFMRGNITPPPVQQRQRQYGFMGGKEEKEIAAMFGML